MKKNIFAIISDQLGKRLNKAQVKLDAIDGDLTQTEQQLQGATGTKKRGLRNMQCKLEEDYRKQSRKVTALETAKQSVDFMDALLASFKNRWIPLVALFVLVMGPVTKGVVSFITGTVVNAVILFVLLGVVMYAFRKHMTSAKLKNAPLVKGIFLALVVEKVLYTMLGTGWMIAITVIAAIAIALYIERDDLKTIIQRWSGKDDK